MPSSKMPNMSTSPLNALDEFLPVVAAESRVRIIASKMDGTSPQPETVREGAGIAAGAA